MDVLSQTVQRALRERLHRTMDANLKESQAHRDTPEATRGASTKTLSTNQEAQIEETSEKTHDGTEGKAASAWLGCWQPFYGRSHRTREPSQKATQTR